MKKILSLFLVLSVFFCEASANEVKSENNDVHVMFVFEEEEEVMPLGNLVVDSYRKFNLPTHYDQNDYTDRLGVCDTSTIKSAGCALTAIALVRDYFIGQPYKAPDVLNVEFMIPNKFCEINNWEYVNQIGLYIDYDDIINNKKYSYQNGNMQEFGDLIKDAIDSRQLVIMQVDEWHYLVVHGYKKYITGDYVIYVQNTGLTDIYDINDTLDKWEYINQIIPVSKL